VAIVGGSSSAVLLVSRKSSAVARGQRRGAVAKRTLLSDLVAGGRESEDVAAHGSTSRLRILGKW
jgi:hypothetical protein